MPSQTHLQRLASHLLGEPVVPWIRTRRSGPACPHCGAAGKKPWRDISTELTDATKGEIAVPIQTLINWAPDTAELAEQAS